MNLLRIVFLVSLLRITSLSQADEPKNHSVNIVVDGKVVTVQRPAPLFSDENLPNPDLACLKTTAARQLSLIDSALSALASMLAAAEKAEGGPEREKYLRIACLDAVRVADQVQGLSLGITLRQGKKVPSDAERNLSGEILWMLRPVSKLAYHCEAFFFGQTNSLPAGSVIKPIVEELQNGLKQLSENHFAK